MFCSQCGAQLLADAKFCSECGSVVGETKKVVREKKYISDTVLYMVVPVIFLLWRYIEIFDNNIFCLLDSVAVGLLAGLVTYFLYNRSFDKIRVVLSIYLGSVLAMFALNEAGLYVSYKFYMYVYIFYVIPSIIVIILNRFRKYDIKRIHPILFNVITIVMSFLFFIIPSVFSCIKKGYELSGIFYEFCHNYFQYIIVEIVFSLISYFLLSKVSNIKEGETK